MATFLYVFAHPDDESFGPGPGIARQRREGHEVHLLTMTQGEATSFRDQLGYSKPEMARMRYRQMQQVAATLDLTSLTVREHPDNRLAEVNPLVLEEEILDRVEEVRPDVVVTFPLHGLSGHPDHIVTHCAVKRIVCALQSNESDYPSRLAFFTFAPPSEDQTYPDDLQPSPLDQIDCQYPVTDTDLMKGQKALDHYVTYDRDHHSPLEFLADRVPFEIYGESHDPPLASLLESLPTRTGDPSVQSN